jgi:hypothetical protein
MKKLFWLILAATVILTGSSSAKDKPQKDAVASNLNEFTAVSMKDMIEKLPSCIQNDLVYHDYGTGVELSDGSSLSIRKLDLDLKSDETAVIIAYEMKDQTVTEVCDYVPGQKVVFVADKDGIYQLLAFVSNSNIKDLTRDAYIATVSSSGNKDGLIQLY